MDRKGSTMIDRLISWIYINRLWGRRCSDYEPECPSCREWAMHDWMFNDGAHPDDRQSSGL